MYQHLNQFRQPEHVLHLITYSVFFAQTVTSWTFNRDTWLNFVQYFINVKGKYEKRERSTNAPDFFSSAPKLCIAQKFTLLRNEIFYSL